MKSLIIYFSRKDENYGVGKISKGNTEVIAEYIKKYTGADVFQCVPVNPYPEDYKACCDKALDYQKHNARPELGRYLLDINDYDVLYIGGPIYWGEYPYEIYSELDRLDFRGKGIKPFSTHEGSGLGNCIAVLKEKCLGGTVMPGLAIKGFLVHEDKSEQKVKGWIVNE